MSRVIANGTTYYREQDRVILESVSNIVKAACTPFNAVEASIGYAKKHGRTPEYWREQWAAKGKEREQAGNDLHEEREYYLEGRGQDVFRGKVLPVRNKETWHDAIACGIRPPYGIYTEIALEHKTYYYAGRPDKLIIPSPYSMDIHIQDYKRIERLYTTSYQYKNGAHKMMKEPVSHLQDCNYNQYMCKESLYALMLEAMGFKIASIELIHYGPGINNDFKSPPEIVPLPYAKKEALMLATEYRKQYKQQLYDQT